METIIISVIALVVACVALLVALKNREELREIKRDQENYFMDEGGIIYTKPQYKGLVSRGFLAAQNTEID